MMKTTHTLNYTQLLLLQMVVNALHAMTCKGIMKISITKIEPITIEKAKLSYFRDKINSVFSCIYLAVFEVYVIILVVSNSFSIELPSFVFIVMYLY